jgi:hypothetical protein
LHDDPNNIPAYIRACKKLGFNVKTISSKRGVWEAAAEMLIKAATEQWPVMFAAIAMRKALNADRPVSTGLRHGGAIQPQRKPARKYRIVR